MEPLSAVPPGVRQIVVAVEASLEKLVLAAAEAIWAEVPAYAASPDGQLRDDVTAHVRGIFPTLLAGLRAGQPARRADFAGSREQASRRVVQGVTLADFLQAFRIGQLTLPRGGAAAAVTGLRRCWTDLARRGVRLAIGVSTVHAGLGEVPEAYAEARAARDGLGGSPGVLALSALSSFDYLVLREDETARRLIRPQVRQFVADDLAAGGTLITTLVEFAACDMNAKTAAERLHLHVNTAYYRLERIATRTGCDLRRLADVMELLIAIRLLGAA